jgi:hypothetical protein
LLVGSHDDADGHVVAGELAVALNDRAVLGTIEIELEDDPMRLVELGAALTAEERTEPVDLGPGARQDRVTEALEDGRVEVALSGKHVEEYDTARGVGGCRHLLASSLFLAASAVQRLEM